MDVDICLRVVDNPQTCVKIGMLEKAGDSNISYSFCAGPFPFP